MSQRLAGLVLVAALGAFSARGYTVVTTDGRKLSTDGPPEYRDGKALLMLPGGMLVELADPEVDRSATAAANAKEDEAGSVFTNRDLTTAKGLSSVEGEVTAEGMGKVIPEASPPLEDIVRPGAVPSQPVSKSPVSGEVAQASKASKRVVDLQRELGNIQIEIVRRCGTATSRSSAHGLENCDSSLYDKRAALMAEMQEALGERTDARKAAHETEVERLDSRMTKEERRAEVDRLEKRRAELEVEQRKCSEALSPFSVVNRQSLSESNRCNLVADDLRMVVEELAAARRE